MGLEHLFDHHLVKLVCLDWLMKIQFTFIALAAASLTGCATVPVNSVLTAQPIEIQILALNDFHGNLEQSQSETTFSDGNKVRREKLGGAAHLGASLDRLRKGQDHSITVAAGDLIGASPLVSAYFLDEPAILALSQIGLNLASVGNHEFDKGVPELQRMQEGGCDKFTSREPCGLEQFSGATFTYLAGNVANDVGETVFPATAIRDFGPVKVGFMGLTLKDTKSLVSPAATRGYRFLDEAKTANTLARQLRSQGADMVVLLIHQGGWTKPSFNTSGCPELSGDILPILDALDPSINLIVSGHTHNAYICEIPTSDTDSRLLTSAGRYGRFVTDIRILVEPETGHIIDQIAVNVPITSDEGEQTATAELVRRYVSAAKPISDRVVASFENPLPEDDCLDTTAQVLIADAQLDASDEASEGGAQIAFINSGGVRTNLSAAADGTLTYGEIFAMQPFGNSLVVLELSGAQLKAVLEQQFCRKEGTTPCYSLLIPSAPFEYDIKENQPKGSRITAMRFDSQPLDMLKIYRITVNNFLANGGDGFTLLTEAKIVAEAGLDVDALEAYLGRGRPILACGRVTLLN